MSKSDTVLITGGAGFIGSHTTELLLNEGKKVIVLDNLSSGKMENININHPNLEFVFADVTHYDSVLTHIQRSDSVIHLAALPLVQKTIEDPLSSLQINVLGFVNILQAIRFVQRPIKLVYASSAAVYGDSTVLPCNDNAPLNEDALSPYALEKANNERYAALFDRLFNIKSIGLRYFNIYGPRQNSDSSYSGVISTFIDSYKRNQSINVFGDGSQSRDFIYVKDIAHANLCAMQSSYNGILNVATGKPISIYELIKTIENIGKKPAHINFLPPRVGDIKRSYATIEKANQSLNFHFKTDLFSGIKSLLEIF